jgi:uncharacterized protein
MTRPKRAAILAFLTAAAAAPLSMAQVSLPPRADRSVHDLAGVISPENAALMERLHRPLFEKTGVAIVVVTVPRLDGEPIEDFAVRVGVEWGAGRKGEDRGIVVALAIEERRVFIATGYGVEGFLPDGKVGGILDQEVLPDLRRGAWSEGMLRASAALVREAAAEYGVDVEDLARAPAPRASGRGGGIARLIPFLIMAVIVFLIIREPRLLLLLLASGGRRGRGGFRTGGFGGGGFGGGTGFGGFGGGGFGGGGAGRGF